MTIELSEHFTYKKLLRFVYPAVIMMVFTSVYGVVDGVFVSNFAGEKAFEAVNLIMPVLMILATVGFMIGTGGSALISKTLGEGETEKARGIFSMLIYVTVIFGIILTVVGVFTLRPIAILLKAEREGILYECEVYGFINMLGVTLFMLQNVFQSFFPLAEKPKLGLAVIVCAGVTNALLDALFIAGFKMGLVGAALATVIGQAVGGLLPVVYFAVNRKCVLHLCKPLLSVKALLKSCANGSSEMMTNVSLSLVTILYNYQLMLFAGRDGVFAYGVLMYVNFIFVSVFIGYSIGVTPIIGYNYGADNKQELNNILKKSLIIIAVTSAAMFTLAVSLHYPLSLLFVRYNAELFEMTRRGFLICAPIFLIMGFNIFGSSFFTALNNGFISAVISFMRTLVLQIVCILTLPLIWQLDGVWAANVFAEILALGVTFTLFMTHRKKYGYFIRIEKGGIKESENDKNTRQNQSENSN